MSLPSFINTSSLSYYDQRNVISDIDAAYLNSIQYTNGLSGQSCTLMQDSEQKTSYNLEHLAHMIDFT